MTALQDLSNAVDGQMATIGAAESETNVRGLYDYRTLQTIADGVTLYQLQLVYTGANRQSSNVTRDQITVVLNLAHRLLDRTDERAFALDYAGVLSKYWTDAENWKSVGALWDVAALDADEAWTRLGNVLQWSVRAVLVTP